MSSKDRVRTLSAPPSSSNSEPREAESTNMELQPVDRMGQRSREGRTSLGSSIDAQLRNVTDLFPAFGNQRSPKTESKE
jgi:hypothetical protein